MLSGWHQAFITLCVVVTLLAPSQVQCLSSEYERSEVEDPAAEVPSITGVARASFFSYASQVAVQIIKARFKPVEVPSVQTVIHVPVVGTFDIFVEDTHLQSLDLSEQATGLSLGADSNFVVTLNQMQAGVDAHFRFRRTAFPFIKGGGSLHIDLHDGRVTIAVKVVNDGSGRPRIILTAPLQASFSAIDLHISGCKFAWLYNIVVQLAHRQVRDLVTREVQTQVALLLPTQVNQVLGGVPTTVDVKGLQLNTSMEGDPAVTAAQLIVQDWGRFQSPTGAWQECPYKRTMTAASHTCPTPKIAEPASDPESGLKPEIVSRMLMSRRGADLADEQPCMGSTAVPGDPNAMMSALVDQSIVNCFTWVLYNQGKLDRYLVGDQVPNKVLYTNSWLLVVPQLVWYYPGRRMGLLVHVSAPPDTAIKASQGISSKGNATLAFYLDDEESGDDDRWDQLQASGLEGTGLHEQHLPESMYDASLQADAWSLGDWNVSSLTAAPLQVGARGKHLFTLSVGGELLAKDAKIEADTPLRPAGFRLRIAMEILKDSLSIGLVKSDVGDINEDRLKTLTTLAAFLVEAKINDEILKDGFPLPDIPHVQVVNPGVEVVDFALSLDSSVQYVP